MSRCEESESLRQLFQNTVWSMMALFMLESDFYMARWGRSSSYESRHSWNTDGVKMMSCAYMCVIHVVWEFAFCRSHM